MVGNDPIEGCDDTSGINVGAFQRLCEHSVAFPPMTLRAFMKFPSMLVSYYKAMTQAMFGHEVLSSHHPQHDCLVEGVLGAFSMIRLGVDTDERHNHLGAPIENLSHSGFIDEILTGNPHFTIRLRVRIRGRPRRHDEANGCRTHN